jgi:hypothetical protein
MLKLSLFIRVLVLFLECYILLGVVAWVEATTQHDGKTTYFILVLCEFALLYFT